MQLLTACKLMTLAVSGVKGSELLFCLAKAFLDLEKKPLSLNSILDYESVNPIIFDCTIHQ